MQRNTLAWAAFIGMLAVALGAFGAHGVEQRVDARAYHNWTTAANYQFYHALALLGLAAVDGRIARRFFALVRTLFLTGMLLFCGSLYLLALRGPLGLEGWTPVLGPITPLGGLCLIAGWAALFVAALRKGD